MIEILRIAAWYGILLYAGMVILFGNYIVVMSLKGARDRGGLSKRDKIFGYPWVPPGLLIDFIVNMLLSFFYLDPPREFLVTSRLQRYRTEVRYAKTWREAHATKVCRWISKYDPNGAHC